MTNRSTPRGDLPLRSEGQAALWGIGASCCAPVRCQAARPVFPKLIRRRQSVRAAASQANRLPAGACLPDWADTGPTGVRVNPTVMHRTGLPDRHRFGPAGLAAPSVAEMAESGTCIAFVVAADSAVLPAPNVPWISRRRRADRRHIPLAAVHSDRPGKAGQKKRGRWPLFTFLWQAMPTSCRPFRPCPAASVHCSSAPASPQPWPRS